MIAPAIPKDESERLSALYKVKILDSSPEERFDRIVNLTSDFFNMPICYVAFVDHDRQWLKASCGLNFKQSDRSVSFCGHTINYDDILIVPDASKDERFHDNPLVVNEPHIRFYAGVPIRSIDGKKIGTLCIAHREPADMNKDQIDHLISLASLTEDQVNLFDSIYLKNEILEKKNRIECQSKMIEQSITCARNIQISTLQSEAELYELVPNSLFFHEAKDTLSGDFFLAKEIGKYRYVAVADSTGHGVPGALVSITCYNALETAINEEQSEDLGGILDRTNELVVARFTSLHRELNDGMDVSIICHNIENNTFHFAAANNSAYLFKKSEKGCYSELTELKADRQPIGRYLRRKKFTTHCVKIDEGDALYMCSDGAQDQFGGPDNRKFTRKRLRGLLTYMQKHDQEDRIDIFSQQFYEWKGQRRQTDDVLLMGLFF
ncbi:MAG: SpoIIE family protein phosphatase [Bacteroidota bacterium]